MAESKELRLGVVVPLTIGVASIVAAVALTELAKGHAAWLYAAALVVAVASFVVAGIIGWRAVKSGEAPFMQGPKAGDVTVWGNKSKAFGGDAGTSGDGGAAHVVGHGSQAIGGKGGNAPRR